ncbi:MAG: hypothetical protein H2056_07610, partial [Sphingopyxis sp.]|nr:hypothetical protein [Sphingopyxis sp.]
AQRGIAIAPDVAAFLVQRMHRSHATLAPLVRAKTRPIKLRPDLGVPTSTAVRTGHSAGWARKRSASALHAPTSNGGSLLPAALQSSGSACCAGTVAVRAISAKCAASRR